jgi:FkbM family methyltransferase
VEDQLATRLLSRGGRLRTRLARIIPPALSVRLRAYLHRLCREPEIGMLQRLCDKRRISLDIGANRGQFAYFLGRYSSDVVCFEPQPQLASYLRASLGGAASVRQCALSDTTGRGTLHIPTIDGERENDGLASLVQFDDRPAKRIDVDVRRLDDFGLSDVGFMKIDVEGMETAVLRGGMRLIERERPALLVESERRHSRAAPDSVFSLLGRIGYCGFFWLGGHWHPVSEFNVDAHQNERNLPDPHGQSHGCYINNFLFLPNERDAPALPGLARRENARVFALEPSAASVANEPQRNRASGRQSMRQADRRRRAASARR